MQLHSINNIISYTTSNSNGNNTNNNGNVCSVISYIQTTWTTVNCSEGKLLSNKHQFTLFHLHQNQCICHWQRQHQFINTNNLVQTLFDNVNLSEPLLVETSNKRTCLYLGHIWFWTTSECLENRKKHTMVTDLFVQTKQNEWMKLFFIFFICLLYKWLGFCVNK